VPPQTLRERRIELRKDAGSDYETHGWVWLFFRECSRHMG